MSSLDPVFVYRADRLLCPVQKPNEQLLKCQDVVNESVSHKILGFTIECSRYFNSYPHYFVTS